MSNHLRAKAQLAAVKALTKIISIPRPLVFVGADSALNLCAHIHHLGMKHVLIVTDSILLGLGVVAPVQQALESHGIRVSIFSGVKPDPTFDVVELGLQQLKSLSCDSVLAVGGGSAMDSAKVIALSASNNKSPKKLIGLLKARKPALPLFVIPTTSGTGSEVTIGAVLSDNKTHQKGLVIDPKVSPLAAALDPKIMQGMPKSITADTGLDALTHALEAWVSSFANPESDYYAKAAIKLIFKNLPIAYQDGQNLAAREAMGLASHYAGLALNHTGVGYVHAIAHQFGALYGIPHGRANAVVMPHVFEFGRDVCESRLAEIAKEVGLVAMNASNSLAANALLDRIKSLLTELNIETKVKELRNQDFDKIIKAVFAEAHGMYSVPKYMQYQDVLGILQKL